jgi:hypothetical protein
VKIAIYSDEASDSAASIIAGYGQPLKTMIADSNAILSLQDKPVKDGALTEQMAQQILAKKNSRSNAAPAV